MYHEYPIEQLARSANSRFQMGFARITMHLAPQFEEAVLEPTTQGLMILAASEVALAMPAEVIRQIHGDTVELGEPQVRLLYGDRVREPVMWVRARIPSQYTEAGVQDLIGRGAEIEEIDRHVPVFTVRAKAALRQLLGYPKALEALTHGAAELQMWLSHYAPVPPEPGRAA